jgi:N6-adenosine-specific RNA methylase IME4
VTNHSNIIKYWADLRPYGRGFDFIMADPPWKFVHRSKKGETAKSADGQYLCQSLDWIKSLPVADLLAGENCVLWLWATNPMLPQAFEVLAAWGFTFKTSGHWSKKTKHGKQAFGTGYILRCAGEPFLIGTRGKPKTARNVRSVIEGKIRKHSQKPDEAFRAAEAMMPARLYPAGVQRLELFSRTARPNWKHWGDQSDSIPLQENAYDH